MTPDEFETHMDFLVKARRLSIGPDERGVYFDAVRNVESVIFGVAIDRFLTTQDSYPGPAALRKACSDVMRERLAFARPPSPPSGLSQAEYAAWEQEWRRSVYRGETDDHAEAAALRAVEAAKAAPALGAGFSSARVAPWRPPSPTPGWQ